MNSPQSTVHSLQSCCITPLRYDFGLWTQDCGLETR